LSAALIGTKDIDFFSGARNCDDEVAMKVLIVPDKFKGTLTAQQAAEAMAEGWREIRAQDEVEMLPMSDGGDGFGEVMSSLLGAVPQKVKTIDAAHRPCDGVWWWHAESETAIIESARVIGLALLPPGKYHPFELDTEGLAALLQAALSHGARRCVIGIGGSATNDGGFGVARGLGWQFFGLHDEKITRWSELRDLALIKRPEMGPWFEEISVAVDVQNPLLGPQGCTRVYGPQKGLRPQDFEFAEECLAQLAEVVGKQLHLSHQNDPGAGAAGGLGYGLRCFAGASLQPGFALFARHADLTQGAHRLRRFGYHRRGGHRRIYRHGQRSRPDRGNGPTARGSLFGIGRRSWDQIARRYDARLRHDRPDHIGRRHGAPGALAESAGGESGQGMAKLI
jgi:glycerate 2-kinase